MVSKARTSRRPRSHRTQYQVQDSQGNIVATSNVKREADTLARDLGLKVVPSRQLVAEATSVTDLSQRISQAEESGQPVPEADAADLMLDESIIAAAEAPAVTEVEPLEDPQPPTAEPVADATPTTIRARDINRLNDEFAQAQRAVLRGVSPGQDLNNAQRLAQRRINEYWREFGHGVSGLRSFYESQLRWFPRAIASSEGHIRDNLARQRRTGEDRSYNIGLYEARIERLRGQQAEAVKAQQDFDAYVRDLRPRLQETINESYNAIPGIVGNLTGVEGTQAPERTTGALRGDIADAGGVGQAIASGAISRQEAVSLGVPNDDVSQILDQSQRPQVDAFPEGTRFQLVDAQGQSAGFAAGQEAIDEAIDQGFTVEPVELQPAPSTLGSPTPAELREMPSNEAEAIRTAAVSLAQELRSSSPRVVSPEEFLRYRSALDTLRDAGIVSQDADGNVVVENLAEARVRGFGSELETIGYSPDEIEESVQIVRGNAAAAREFRDEVSRRQAAIRELQRVAPHVIAGSGGVDLATAHIEGLDRLTLQAGYTQQDIDRANQQLLEQHRTQAEAARALRPWLSPAGLDVLGAIESGIPRETFVDYGLSPAIYEAAEASVQQFDFPGQRQEAFTAAVTNAPEETLGEPYVPTLGQAAPSGRDLQREALLEAPVQDVFDATTGRYLRTQDANIGTNNVIPRAEIIGETISTVTTPLTAGFAQVIPGAKPADYNERLAAIQDAYFGGRLSLSDATRETQILLSETGASTRIPAEVATSLVLASPFARGPAAARPAAELAGGPGRAPIPPGFSRPAPTGFEPPASPTAPFGPRLIPSAIPGRVAPGSIPGRVGGGVAGGGDVGGLPILTRGPGGVPTVTRAELLPPALRPNPVPTGSVIRIGARGEVAVEPAAPLTPGRLVLPADVPRVQGLGLDDAVGIVQNLSDSQQILFLRGLSPQVAVGVVPLTTVGQALPASQRQAFISALGQGWKPVLKPDGSLAAVEAPVREPDIDPGIEPEPNPDFDPLPSTEPDIFDPFDPRTYPQPEREPEVLPDVGPDDIPEADPFAVPSSPPETEPEIPPDIIVRPAEPIGPEVRPIPTPPFRTFPEDTPFEPELTPFAPGPQPLPRPGPAPSELPESAPFAPDQPPVIDPLRPGVTPGVRPDTAPAIAPITSPVTQPEPAVLPQPELQPFTQPQPQPDTQVQAGTRPQPQARPQPQVQPAPQTLPQPATQPQAVTQPLTQPQPQPVPQPRPQPQPRPATPTVPRRPIITPPRNRRLRLGDDDIEGIESQAAGTTPLRTAGINRGFLDTTVDFTSGEVSTFGDSPDIPEGPTRRSFTPLTYSEGAVPELQRIPWGANDLIVGPMGSFRWVKAGEPLPEARELLPASEFGNGTQAASPTSRRSPERQAMRSRSNASMRSRGRGL